MAFLATEHHGDNAGQWSRLVERDREHAKKKAKPHKLSIFNLGSSPVSALPSFFPSKGKKGCSAAQAPGEATHTPFAERRRGLRESTRLQNTPNPTELSAFPGYQLFSCGFSQSLTHFPPQHPSPQPGEERHLAESFSGFHLEKQSNGFYGSPLLPGILKWDLPTGACKRAG